MPLKVSGAALAVEVRLSNVQTKAAASEVTNV